jgi:hypothetical protein
MLRSAFRVGATSQLIHENEIVLSRLEFPRGPGYYRVLFISARVRCRQIRVAARNVMKNVSIVFAGAALITGLLAAGQW